MVRLRVAPFVRRFVTVSHTAPADGAWAANDLPGTGRVDVVCRNLQAALFLSHGLRSGAEFYAVFENRRSVRVQADAIQRLHPDERSTAARLAGALRDSWNVPDWKELQPGLSVAAFDLKTLLAETPATPVLLDPDGTPIQQWQPPAEPLFLLSDHVPFAPEDLRDLPPMDRVSLGTPWYHGNHAISVVHWFLDQKRVPAVSS